MAKTIKGILKLNTTNYIIIDWLSITNNVSEPLFAKPFPPEFMIDILSGKVKVIMGLDLDKLIDAFNIFDLPTRWITPKETAKAKQAKNAANAIVIVNKRAICFKIDKQDIILSGGIVSKLLYDCILPSNMATTILTSVPDIQVEDEGKEE